MIKTRTQCLIIFRNKFKILKCCVLLFFFCGCQVVNFSAHYYTPPDNYQNEVLSLRMLRQKSNGQQEKSQLRLILNFYFSFITSMRFAACSKRSLWLYLFIISLYAFRASVNFPWSSKSFPALKSALEEYWASS